MDIDTLQDIAEMFLKRSLTLGQCLESARAMNDDELGVALRFAESYLGQEDEAPHPALLLGYAEYGMVLFKAAKIKHFAMAEIERRQLAEGVQQGKPGRGPQRM